MSNAAKLIFKQRIPAALASSAVSTFSVLSWA